MKECFFWKIHIFVYHSQILSNNVRIIGRVFSTELSKGYSRCQNEPLEWKTFSKKKIFIMFSGLWLENLRICSVSFRQLWQNCIYVSIGMFWSKEMISERDVIFREFNGKILDLRWSYSAGLSKQHSKGP